ENFSHLTNNTVDGPLWSVVVEVQFYVLLPVLAWLVARGRLRTGGIVLGNLVVLSTAGFAIAAAHGATDDLVWRTSLPVTFFFFTPGLLLAWLEIWWTAQPRRGLPSPLDRATVWFVASIAVWLVWRLVSGSPLEMLLAANFLAVGSCVLPLRGGWSMAFLAWRPLAMLGVASYSLYVWHVPILEAIEHWPVVSRYYGVLGLVGGALSIGAALVSYRLVEYPFLRLRRRWSRSAASATMPSGSAENPEPEPGEVDDGIDGHRDALRQQVVQAG
ncbi:MAG: acyltransferase, partial [Frankiales bacterium]|nr:acyltransferase [Frankiales bacterium]